MRLPPSIRKFILATHISLSVGWIGAVVAYLALDLTVASSDSVPTLRASYIGMDLVTAWALVPLAWGAFLTGVVISLVTPWGLFRHYWVIISLLLTGVALLVLLIEAQVIEAYASVAADPDSSDQEVRSLGTTLAHSVGGLLILVITLVLNVYKPRGVTPYGWRKQEEQRLAPDSV